MDKAYIYSKLCYYDTRNPKGVISDSTEQEIVEAGYTTEPKQNCTCDNCFYGRTELAMYILEMYNKTT